MKNKLFFHLIILLLFLNISFGQDSIPKDDFRIWIDNATTHEVLIHELLVNKFEKEKLENRLDSIDRHLLKPTIYYLHNDKSIKHDLVLIDTRIRILNDFNDSERVVMLIEKGNLFQSLLRSFCIIIPSIFSTDVGDQIKYRKLDQFCTHFFPSYGKEFTNSYALEELQNIYLEYKSSYNKEIFEENELSYIFDNNIFEITLNNKNIYSDPYFWWGDFCLYNIVKYTRYFLFALVIILVILYIRKKTNKK